MLQSKLNPKQDLEVSEMVINELLSGTAVSIIVSKIMDGYSQYGVTEYIAKSQIAKAHKRIVEMTMQEVEEIVALHVIHYERIYKHFADQDMTYAMNKALKAKERLLGHGREDKKVVINNNTLKQKIIVPVVEYDFNKLTPEKQNRIKLLINKAK